MMKESRISKSIKTIPPCTSCAILIRHAERSIIEMSGDFGDSVSITEKGVIESNKLGRRPFMRKLNGVYSSPLPRCVQTASVIIKATGLVDLAINTKSTLGKPGSYIDDPSLAGKHFLMRDSRSIIREYMDGGKLDGFLPLREGSERLLSDILYDFSPERSYNLYVSHDAIIMPFISYHTGEMFRDDWLGFLDGVIITRQNGHVKMIWDGEEYPLEGALK
jgi:hypothetical protein